LLVLSLKQRGRELLCFRVFTLDVVVVVVAVVAVA
jgi:hypothetical protein